MHIDSHITAKFKRMHARVRFAEVRLGWRQNSLQDAVAFRFDIGKDARGQFFDLRLNPVKVKDVLVLDSRPRERHLLLMVREQIREDRLLVVKDHRVLMGHDEREWFLAGLPESQRVTTVRQAMEALKPDDVKVSQARHGVKTRNLNKRRNGGFKRQGEWFFIPVHGLPASSELVHRNEPLQRGAGKPHIAQFLVRTGGRTGYVRSWGGKVYEQEEWHSLIKEGRGGNPRSWQIVTIEPEIYVRGRVRHPDHKTVDLPGWHRVLPNTEQESGTFLSIAYVD